MQWRSATTDADLMSGTVNNEISYATGWTISGLATLGTIVAIWLLDRTGRRPLLLIGTAGMAVGMLITAFAFFGGDQLTGGLAYLAIAGLIVYTGSFAVGLGPVFWLMIAEIYPLRIRGQAMSVATIANWGANFVVTISFLTLLNAITPKGVFFMFAFLTVVALAYFANRAAKRRAQARYDGPQATPGRQRSVQQRAKKAEDTAKAAQAGDGYWDPDELKARVRQCFFPVQSSWSARDRNISRLHRRSSGRRSTRCHRGRLSSTTSRGRSVVPSSTMRFRR